MKDVIEIALAAFMHDWGKPLQRARVNLSDQVQRMSQMLCPTRDGVSTHRHVLWTNDFLENHLHWLPSGVDRARIIQLASNHHRPSTDHDFLISEGDRLASGHDRRDGEERRKDFRRVPLSSIFAGLHLQPNREISSAWLAPQGLRTDESIFPSHGEWPSSLESEYQRVCNTLKESIQSWATIPGTRVCDGIAGLSEYWLTTTPASTQEKTPDVSLHDHSSLVAAMACALYVYHRDNGTLTEREICDRSVNKFRLVSGDLSGIQQHLFDLPKEGAKKGIARSYRARSFFLSMLTHAVSLEILTLIGLPCFNRVMDAGGRFALLIPNTDSALEVLRRVRGQLDAWMLGRYAGGLTLNLDWSLQVCGNDFIGESFIDLFRRFRHAGQTAKRRKLSEWMVGDGVWNEDHQRLAYVHGRERQEEHLKRDVSLGRALPKARYVGIWTERSPNGLLKDGPLDILGNQFQLFDREPDPRNIAEAVDFFAIQDVADRSSWIRHRPVANYVPFVREEERPHLQEIIGSSEPDADDDELRPGNLKTFAHLAFLSRRPKPGSRGEYEGLPAIACLKADVDRLGLIFGHGFEGDVSFGRIATLSRQLDWFFKGFLDARLAESDGPFANVYTVFAGGDDLMLIGPWPVMFKLAVDLRRWFGQLTGNNPDLTLSAGIALGHPRMPVSILGRMAEELLHRAKEGGRNRIMVFNRIYQWPEFEQALRDGRRLDELVTRADDRDSLSLKPAFVYRLLQYERMAERVDEARKTEERIIKKERIPPQPVRLSDLHSELTWRSHLQYDLQRNIRDKYAKRTTPEIQKDLEWLESLLTIHVKPESARQLRLAATYALYRNRGG